jgi:hypothetical protein
MPAEQFRMDFSGAYPKSAYTPALWESALDGTAPGDRTYGNALREIQGDPTTDGSTVAEIIAALQKYPAWATVQASTSGNAPVTVDLITYDQRENRVILY